MSTCRGCGAEITWTRTMTGRRMPIDPEPVEDGNIRLLGTNFVGEEIARVTTKAERRQAIREGKPLYRSHFNETCSRAGEFRKALP